ncbi:MAG: flagellar motor protein MotB [Elusimicrobia bacterium]|nr:flagellar motor protein MotB [Elusimicrobiota bacterium]
MPIRPPKGFIDESDPKVCQIGHPAPPWLVNYADLMTELVCFFIILYALSAALNKNVQNAAEQVKDMIERKEIAGEAKISKEGLQISLEEQGKKVFFQSGSAELTTEMEGLLDKLAPVLQKLVDSHDIVIEGHTDAIPIKNDLYQSNWELSAGRATNVVEYMIQKKGFPPGRMAATGYGEFRPLCKEDTPECMSRNRRVVFLVKNSPTPPPAEAKAPSKEKAPVAAPPAAPPSGENAPPKPGWLQRMKAWLLGLVARFRPK